MDRPVISMRKLGEKGRFGNQVFQYMFLNTYAREHDFELQTPAWIGQTLFGFRDPPISRPLQEFVDPYETDPRKIVLQRKTSPVANVDFNGYFQYPSRFYAPHRTFIQDLFNPVNEIRKPLDEAIGQLRVGRRTVVGLHIRRGDYGYGPFYITPVSWYIALLKQILPALQNSVVFVATDEPETVLPKLKAFSPVTCRDLGVTLPVAPFYPDFYLLSQSDFLLIPNSSFSFAAAMLNKRLQAAYRSHLSYPLEDPPFRRIDPWDANVLERQATVENHPMVPGIGVRNRSRFFSRKYWLGRKAS